jgi:GntR family transcriptional regulator / MocR family aminotransferase
MELTLHLDPQSDEPLYMQLYRFIRNEILNGGIPSGAKLPSIRALCSRLGTSRTPVALAYEQLQAEGYLISRPRSGLYAVPLEETLKNPPIGAHGILSSKPAEHAKPLSDGALVQAQTSAPLSVPHRAYHASPDPFVHYDFGYGAVDLSAFPLTRWRRLFSRTMLPENNHLMLYGDIQGDVGLREQIAAYLRQTRGVCCQPEQIVIGAGTYHSLDLVFQLLDGDISALAAEEAVNDGVKSLFRRFGFVGDSCLPLPLEADGISLGPLIDSKAQAVYVTPSHQFPYGMILSAGKRLRLLQWARERSAYIIENDYDGEYRYGGRPIPSLQGMDSDGRVIYTGTFSRALTPSFRISYLVLPLPLLKRFRSGGHSYDQLASPLVQDTLRRFMETGELERHMRRMKVLYQKKHDALLDAVRREFGCKADVIGAGSGLHILLRYRGGIDEPELIRLAARNSVQVYPASVYALDPAIAAESTVLLGFGGLSLEDIQEGIRLLAGAWAAG